MSTVVLNPLNSTIMDNEDSEIAPPQIQLMSSDMKILIADRDAMMVSTTIQKKFDEADLLRIPGIPGSDPEPVDLPDVGCDALQKIISWCEFHKEDYETLDILYRNKVMTNFDREFFEMDENLLINVINAAGTLDIKGLMDQCALALSMKISNKSPRQIRRRFNAPDRVMRLVTRIDNASKNMRCNIL